MIRPSSLTDLHQTLTRKLEKHPKISLIVVDTINAYVRLSYLKNKELSSRQFLEMTSILQPLAVTLLMLHIRYGKRHPSQE